MTALAAVLPPPVLSLYLVAGFITARRSAGRAASRVLAAGLVALVLLLPSTVFLMWLVFHPPLFVYDVFMVKAPVVLVLFP